MTSVLRQLQAEWNTLVPTAQARGVRRVRMLNAPLETIEYRRAKLEWLRSQLGSASDLDALTFGVELEVIMPVGMTREGLAGLIARSGVSCQADSYGHVTRTYWKVVTDGSLGDYTRGCEIVSPVLKGESGFEALRKVCQVLKSSGCNVNKRCGFHVHVGARSESIDFFKNLIRLYASAERAIDTFLSPSRRSNSNEFCRNLQVNLRQLDAATTVDAVAAAIRQSSGAAQARSTNRYSKLNLQSFWQHGTVEFRHHQGTIESDKADNWVRLCLRMCLTARAGQKVASTVAELMDAVEANPAERDYFARRVSFFRTDVTVSNFTAYGDAAPNFASRRTR